MAIELAMKKVSGIKVGRRTIPSIIICRRRRRQVWVGTQSVSHETTAAADADAAGKIVLRFKERNGREGERERRKREGREKEEKNRLELGARSSIFSGA